MCVIIGGISLTTDDISLRFCLQGIGFKKLIYQPPWACLAVGWLLTFHGALDADGLKDGKISRGTVSEITYAPSWAHCWANRTKSLFENSPKLPS